MVQPQETHRPALRSVLEAYVTVTAATYTAKAGERLIGVNRAGTVTITLPTAQLRAGRTYTIKDESGAAATNNITVATEGSETIDGAATDVISDNYGAKTYYSDGTRWFEVPLLASASHTLDSHGGTLQHEKGGLEADVSAITTGGIFRGSGAGTLGILAAFLTAGDKIKHEMGGLEADVNAGDGFVEIKAGATTVIKSNTAASAAPGATDDSAAGYAVGSVWIDTTNDKAYICLDATASAAVWTEVTQSGGGSGQLKQFVSTQTGTQSSGTTTIPNDNTIPQNTEGDEYMTLAITPNDTSNKLIIEVTIASWGLNAVLNTMFALFQDSTANALASAYMMSDTQDTGKVVTFTHVMDAGTTSSTTFKVRCGASGAGTFICNGTNTAKHGGVLASGIRIWEVTP